MNTNSNSNESNVINHGASSAPSKINASNGVVAGEFHNFINDIEDMIKATTSLTGEDLARARAKLNARVISAKESIEKMSGAIAEQACNTAKITNGYVHAHPWQAMGIGTGLGLLIGLVFARR